MSIPQIELEAEVQTLRAKVFTGLYAAIEKNYEEIEKHKERLSQMMERGRLIEQAAQALLSAYPYTVSFHHFSHFPGDFHITVKDLGNWRDLAPFLEAVSGFVKLEEWETKDDAESFSRIYTNGDVWSSQIILTATLKPDTADCRRVITGWTEPIIMEKKPIYGFECSE